MSAAVCMCVCVCERERQRDAPLHIRLMCQDCMWFRMFHGGNTTSEVGVAVVSPRLVTRVLLNLDPLL